jgi:hypothetical protein
MPVEMCKIKNIKNIEININIYPSQKKTRVSRFFQNVRTHQPECTVSAQNHHKIVQTNACGDFLSLH